MNQEKPLSSASPDSEQMVRVTIELSAATVAWIDELRVQLGLRSRGIIIEQILQELQPQKRSDYSRESHVLRRLAKRSTNFLKNLISRISPSK